MGCRDKIHHHHLNFRLHLHQQQQQQQPGHHHGKEESSGGIPKGCLAIMVGGDGEEPQRLIIPLIYISHPLFIQLLKEAEELYGFDYDGPINLPCHVEEFRHVQDMIDEDKSQAYPQHPIYPGCCFKS